MREQKDQVQRPPERSTSRPARSRRPVARRANDLDGASWTRHSISVWSDIQKSPEELSLKHPAMFPARLAGRLIQCFTTKEDRTVLDPFAGAGSTLLAAEALGKTGVGFDVSEEYVEKARERPSPLMDAPGPMDAGEGKGERRIYRADANHLLRYLAPESVDLVVTSPPYWNILLQKRTADHKEVRHYGDSERDLGKIDDYDEFLDALTEVFKKVYTALRPGKYCCAVVMDIRKRDRFYPLHSDLARRMEEVGFIFDDIIIWDRGHEYNNLRPLGYPAVFRVNKVHEYILIFRKPKGGARSPAAQG